MTEIMIALKVVAKIDMMDRTVCDYIMDIITLIWFGKQCILIQFTYHGRSHSVFVFLFLPQSELLILLPFANHISGITMYFII